MMTIDQAIEILQKAKNKHGGGAVLIRHGHNSGYDDFFIGSTEKIQVAKSKCYDLLTPYNGKYDDADSDMTDGRIIDAVIV